MPKKSESLEKAVPDSSTIIEGTLSKKIQNNELTINEIVIHESLIAELEKQANEHRTTGTLGLEELKRLRDLKQNLRVSGKRPHSAEIQHTNLTDVDAKIRDLAFDEDATFVTSSNLQDEIASIKGITTLLIQDKKTESLTIEKFFDETTMSVHLKENVNPVAKRGAPGTWEFVEVDKKPATVEDIQAYSREIIEAAEARSDAFVEIERPGSTIVQLGRYRIVITRPPFSDGWEITAVRPVKKLTLADYNLSEKLMKRIGDQAEGILIAGSPGMGKSTFTTGLAEYYADQNRIVKTIEAPRDLVLKDTITQYAISHGDAQEIHDILLLSRPDNTVFDEMRNTEDFKLFADMRLAGIGLAGVVHATNPIDAIQRFVGRIELGVIPHVVDTVIFIKNGAVHKVLALKMMVKVPAVMTEEDLARPVVVVEDFETGKQEYELYSYGEETVVIPVEESQGQKKKSPLHNLAEKQIEEFFYQYANDVKVEMNSNSKATVYVPEYAISKIIGKGGKHIEKIEKKLGIKLDIQELQ